MKNSLLLILLLLTSITYSRSRFKEDNLILQAAPVYGARTDGTTYWGGQLCGNYFPLDDGYFAIQMLAGGGPGWFEFSPGIITGPLGILMMNQNDGDMDFGQFLTGLLFVAAALENPSVHIPLGSTITLAPSLHLLRLRWESESNEIYGGGGAGLSFNLFPGKYLALSLFGEGGIRYVKNPTWGGKVGIRIGGVIQF